MIKSVPDLFKGILCFPEVADKDTDKEATDRQANDTKYIIDKIDQPDIERDNQWDDQNSQAYRSCCFFSGNVVLINNIRSRHFE